MSEVYTPEPLKLDTAAEHQVVRGESTSAFPSDIDHLDSMLDDQSNGQTPEKKQRKEVVDGISPENIHLYGKVTMDKMLIARSMVHSKEFAAHNPEERDEIIVGLLDDIMADEDEEKSVYYSHRLKLASMLVQPEYKFQKTHKRKEIDQARRDEVKLAKKPRSEDPEPSEPFAKRVKALFERESDNTDVTNKPVSEAKLNKQIRRLDSRHNGLVGKVAETGTKVSFLESQLDEFHDQMDAHGANVNDKTRRSVERETIGKLVRAKDLADAKGLEGEERKEYIKSLVDTFHDYATLSDEDRGDFHEALSTRYDTSKELNSLQNKSDASPEKDTRVTKIKRSLGSFATRVLDMSASRWNARSTDRASIDEQLALFDEKPYQKQRSVKQPLLSALDTLKNTPQSAYFNLSSRITERQVRKAEMFESMSDDEKRVYKEQQLDKRLAVGVGLGILAIGATAYFAKFGLDNPFNGIGSDRAHGTAVDTQKGGLGDLLNPPTTSETSQEIIPSSEFVPSETGGGSDNLSRSDLFSGHEGSRAMSGTNIEHLKDYLDGYKVKPGDDKGIWGISEEYIKSQGIKNPTVYEIDSVKDYVLKNSSLTDSSVLHAGDTIRLK